MICIMETFKLNVFSLFQLRKRLRIIIYAVHCLLDSWHVFSHLMKLFAKQSLQLFKNLVTSRFLFSLIWTKGRWSQSVSTKWRQLQFTYCISLKHDFLKLVDMIHRSQSIYDRESETTKSSKLGFFRYVCIAVIWHSVSMTVDDRHGIKVPEGL